MPSNVPIIDLMLGIPSPDPKPNYDFMRPLLRDKESLEAFEFPVEYMFKDVPKAGSRDDYIRYTLDEMDKYGIERALIGVDLDDKTSQQALRSHPDRFIASCSVDPNQGVEALRHIQRLHGEGLTLVVVTHDPNVARRAERVLVMVDGRIARRIAPSEVGAGLGSAP